MNKAGLPTAYLHGHGLEVERAVHDCLGERPHLLGWYRELVSDRTREIGRRLRVGWRPRVGNRGWETEGERKQVR
jgi:hypothetical protein